MRIDVFTPASSSLMSRTQGAEVLGIVCRVVAAEDLIAKLVAILCSVIGGKHADPKHYESLNVLSRFANLDAASELWADYTKPEYPQSFVEAVSAVHRGIRKHPETLRKDVYCTDLEKKCPWHLKRKRIVRDAPLWNP